MSVRAMKSTLPQDGVSEDVKSDEHAGHRSGEQMGLRYDGSVQGDEAAWDLILKYIRRIVDSEPLGTGKIASDLDVSPSYLNHCLNERERHNPPMKWLPYFLKKAKDDDLLAFLALLRDRKLGPRVELTPAQKLDRLLTAMSEQLGDDVRRLILDKAFKE